MTRGEAIKRKCRDCIYDECAPGNWVKQVSDCESTDCPLWVFRPISAAAGYENHRKAQMEARNAL